MSSSPEKKSKRSISVSHPNMTAANKLNLVQELYKIFQVILEDKHLTKDEKMNMQNFRKKPVEMSEIRRKI